MTGRVAIACALALLCGACAARSESLAELRMRIVEFNLRDEFAVALVDSIWDTETGANLTKTGMSADCLLPGDQSWFARIRPGDTLRFKLVHEKGYRLAVPHAGWPMHCRCTGGARTRQALLQGEFVLPSGLDDSMRLPGFFGPRNPGSFRLRVGWKSQELSQRNEDHELRRDEVVLASGWRTR